MIYKVIKRKIAIYDIWFYMHFIKIGITIHNSFTVTLKRECHSRRCWSNLYHFHFLLKSAANDDVESHREWNDKSLQTSSRSSEIISNNGSGEHRDDGVFIIMIMISSLLLNNHDGNNNDNNDEHHYQSNNSIIHNNNDNQRMQVTMVLASKHSTTLMLSSHISASLGLGQYHYDDGESA